MPLRVAAHKRSSRGTSCESPAPEEVSSGLLGWSLPEGSIKTNDTYMRHTGKLNLANRRKNRIKFRLQNIAALSPAVSNNQNFDLSRTICPAEGFAHRKTAVCPRTQVRVPRTQRSPEDTSSGRGDPQEGDDSSSCAPSAQDKEKVRTFKCRARLPSACGHLTPSTQDIQSMKTIPFSSIDAIRARDSTRSPRSFRICLPG